MFQRDCPGYRIITHYYYPSWPDRGVPKESSSLCAFTEHVRQDLEAIPRFGPAVVHCRSDLHPITSGNTRLNSALTHSALILWRAQTVHEVNRLFMCCSAGVGRSGTLVTLLWLMQLCVRGIRPDIRAAVADLRLHRMWMVQNLVSPVLTLSGRGRETIEMCNCMVLKKQKCQ